MSTQIISVYLADGTFRNVRVDSFTTVQRILHVVLLGLGMDRLSFGHFALRLATFPTGSGSAVSDTRWLHSSLRMPQIVQRYLQPLSSGSQMRFELRIRFIPSGLYEMYQVQLNAFMYLYEQLLSDYALHLAWKISQEKAFHMAALAIKKRFPKLSQANLEKKFDVSDLDEEGGLIRYLPESIIVSTKKKQLNKSLTASLRKVVHYSEMECVFQFMKCLMGVARFDTEVFRVYLGATNKRSVELFVGHHYGIAYKNENTKEPVVLAELRNVVHITVRRIEAKRDHCAIKVRISGNSSPLIITVTTPDMAESLAHLIDGYQMLLSQQASVWTYRDVRDTYWLDHATEKVTMSPLALRKGKVHSDLDERGQICADSKSLLKSIEIDPQNILLERLLGSGQYGNVYQAVLNKHGHDTPVAVKVCKGIGEETANSLLLDEAYTMSQFCHPHIVHLIGFSVHSTVWVVMELAPLGELRDYLRAHHKSISTSTQLLYCKQLASAVSYLHSLLFVHRDIAARNVLVADPSCVKLSDFGMSRFVEEDFYKSNTTKLPLRWLPLESLTYRRFNTRTDVYMLAVCFWEIFSHGEKPWACIKNKDMARHLQTGELLAQPEDCPDTVFQQMRLMWSMDPSERPDARLIHKRLCVMCRGQERFASGSAPNSPLMGIKRRPRDSRKSFRSSLSSLSFMNSASSSSDMLDLNSNKHVSDHQFKRMDGTSLQDPVSVAVCDLSEAICELEQPLETISGALNSVEKITFLLQELLVISAPHVALLDEPMKRNVDEWVDVLSEDAETLRTTADRLAQQEDGAGADVVDHFVQELLRKSRVVAEHCQGFCDVLQRARSSSGITANH